MKCENEALALGNVRPFCEAFIAHQPVVLQNLQKSIDALERHGFTGITAHGYLLHVKDDIQSGTIT